MTTVIQIGNSDNKLTQLEWGNFIYELVYIMQDEDIHFCGGSSAESRYQNYCIVIDGELSKAKVDELNDLRIDFRQDTIAVTVGITNFIGAENNGE